MKANTKIIPVKLFIGFIFAKEEVYLRTKYILEKKFGLSDFQSQPFDFTHTLYYEKEFGKNLKRRFLSFRKLTSPEKLADIKIITNKIEKSLSYLGNRQINIDPGILTLSKVILASTKDYKHRIYLFKGICAEVTLYYQNNSFQAWEWTYPDYKSFEYIQIFNTIRKIYSQQIKSPFEHKIVE